MTHPLIHVGYHKAGSTWLQRRLFADPTTGFWSPWPREEISRRLVGVDPFEFDPEVARAAFETVGPPPEAACVPVISSEALSGDPHTGGAGGWATAGRLADAFPNARILIVIREQRAMLASQYKQYVRVGGTATLTRYLSPRPLHLGPDAVLTHLRYHRLVGRYHGLFTRQRVLVLPLELLAERADEFVSRIVAFAGGRIPHAFPAERVHPGPSAVHLTVQRQVNKLVGGRGVNPAPLIDAPRLSTRLAGGLVRVDRRLPARLRRRADARLAREVERAAAGRFAESNAITAELTSLDLAVHGYEM